MPPAMLSRLGSEDELLEESQWIAAMISCWLDEEWPAAELVEVHASLGAAAGQAYFRLRQPEGGQEGIKEVIQPQGRQQWRCLVC